MPKSPSYKNPLYLKETWQSFVIARFGMIGWLVLLLIVAATYLLFYSSIFSITSIHVSGGTHTVSGKTLADRFIVWQLGQKKWRLFPQNNLITFSSSWLKDNLNKQYNFESITIKKILPHTLSVTVQDRQPVLIWVSDDSYYYIETNGHVSPLTASQQANPQLPKIFNEANEPVTANQELLTSDKITFIGNLITSLSAIAGVQIDSYSMPHSLSTQINATTKAGYVIEFEMSTTSGVSLDSQITKLREVLNAQVKETPPKEYIDLRAGDRVYLK